MGSRHRHQHKPSIQVTKVYSVMVKYDRNARQWRGPDIHPALRAARYLKGRGHGKIVRKNRYTGTVVVSLHASPAVHKDALKKAREREGVSVAEGRIGGRSHRSSTKWSWQVGVSCPYCGICHRMRHSKGEREHLSETCPRCARRSPIELLAMSI